MTTTQLLASVLTGVLGALLGYYLRLRSWKFEGRHAIHRARFDEGSKFLDGLSDMVGKRFFLLQRLLWALESGDEKIMRRREREYFVEVVQWNACFWKNRNKVRLFVGDVQADEFLDYADDRRGNSPRSLHYTFVVAHRAVLAAKSDRAALGDAVLRTVRLNWRCSVFLERLTADFLRRAAALQLMDIPTAAGGAERAAAAAAASGAQ